MPELRKDYVLDNFVIIATERAKRPDQFKEKQASKEEDVVKCYFCPGNEHLTPPEIGRIINGKGGWQIRYFPNKFPAVANTGKAHITTDNSFFTYSDAYGYHEVIVETPDHDKELADLSCSHITQLLKVYSDRITNLSKDPSIRYVSVFKNSGEAAGTSIVHTHSQVIANNLIPKVILDKESASAYGCPYCKILEIESTSHRQCYSNPTMTAFTPYASRFPFEIWIMPKRHVISLHDFTEQEFIDCADLFRQALRKLKTLNAAYNLVLHYGIRDMHLHFMIMPRLTKWAGFELATGTIINAMPPEKAAEFYRH